MAMNELKLYLPQSGYERFWKIGERRGKTVSVQTEDLKLLLMDHSRALKALENIGVRTVTDAKVD